jgi:methionine synthase II (cobalamin-independent)
MQRLLPIVLKAKPQGLLFEAASPRHAHEWSVFQNARIPDDKILIPGVLATTTNYIEHPLLVAERIERFIVYIYQSLIPRSYTRVGIPRSRLQRPAKAPVYFP